MSRKSLVLLSITTPLLLLNFGCQRVAYVTVENKKSYHIYIYEAASSHFLGDVEPSTKAQLEHPVLLKGTAAIDLIVKNSKGEILKNISIPVENTKEATRNGISFRF